MAAMARNGRPQGLRWLRAGALGLAFLGPLLSTAIAAGVDDYKVKASFLYNFAKFVEWPSQDMVGLEGEVRLCVLGSDKTSAVLAEALDGQAAGKRRVTVRTIDDLTSASWCRIIFVTKESDVEPEVIANSLGAASILTVGEIDEFAARGGMVNFISSDNKVRFEINEAAARRSGLKISSQLLRVASLVEAQ